MKDSGEGTRIFPRASVALIAALGLLGLVSLWLALSLGSATLDSAQILHSLWSDSEDLVHDLVWELRLPRALTAFAVGALLAYAGALMQLLLRNPLGDPYILGVSGGASAAMLCAMLLGLSAAALTTSAFIGALFSMLLVFFLSRGSGSWTPTRLLLTGVVVAAGWSALISFILATSPGSSLPGMLFWLMGDLSGADAPLFPLAVLVVATIVGLALARSLNLFARGEMQAATLGANISLLRLVVYGKASLLTAVAVTMGGNIGFVGLVVPHMLRIMLRGNDHRLLIPGSVLLGGSLLTLADTLSRTLLAPRQLPVGVITAMLGVPIFLYLLGRKS